MWVCKGPLYLFSFRRHSYKQPNTICTNIYVIKCMYIAGLFTEFDNIYFFHDEQHNLSRVIVIFVQRILIIIFLVDGIRSKTLILKFLYFIIHPCDPTVVVCYLIWPCDLTVHMTYLISYSSSSSLSCHRVIKGYLWLGV